MRVHRKESDRLKKTEAFVRLSFPRLGINKKQEITRLLYEISKKDNVSPSLIIQAPEKTAFNKIKKYLLKKRYPYSYLNNAISKTYLPKIKLDRKVELHIGENKFYPKRVFIEKLANRSAIAGRFRILFPEAKFSEIRTLKDYLKKNYTFSIGAYNKRRETAFITHKNYGFFKRCPCTSKAVDCGYNIFNLSFGCIFECTYCYLQEYTNTPGIIFPANVENFFDKFLSYARTGMRIGTGEFSDSLMLDDITEYSLPIVNFFKKHPGVRFEFKTKSANIKNLLRVNHSGNIVISWSLNPQKIIDENEFLTSTLSERIRSAGILGRAGYKLGFHFDPVIFFNGWEKEYEKVTGLLFSSIKPRDIAWISIGTLRFNPKVKQIIENRFPENKILDGELIPGFDGKLRYPDGIRKKIYSTMLGFLLKYSKKLPIYLCMESSSMWKEVGLRV